MAQAIAVSCDPYFYQMGALLFTQRGRVKVGEAKDFVQGGVACRHDSSSFTVWRQAMR